LARKEREGKKGKEKGMGMGKRADTPNQLCPQSLNPGYTTGNIV